MKHIDLIKYGIVPDVTDFNTCAFNSNLLSQITSSSSLVEFSSGKIFCLTQTEFFNLNNVDFQINGHIILSNSMANYQSNGIAMLSFYNSANIRIRGSGKIDGKGFLWWVYVLSGAQDLHGDTAPLGPYDGLQGPQTGAGSAAAWPANRNRIWRLLSLL